MEVESGMMVCVDKILRMYVHPSHNEIGLWFYRECQ